MFLRDKSIKNDALYRQSVIFYTRKSRTYDIKSTPCRTLYLKISTLPLARLGWFCPVASEPVKPYFTRFLRVLTFCLGASKIVILKENGVVNGVVKS